MFCYEMEASSSSPLRDLLRLQQKRCEVYHMWQELFSSFTQGQQTAEDFELATNAILTSLQSINDRMRGVRDHGVYLSEQRREAVGATSTTNAHVDCTPPAVVANAPDEVRQWVASLQLAERSLYENTVTRYKLFIDHCKGTTQPRDAAIDGDVHCYDCFVANSSENRHAPPAGIVVSSRRSVLSSAALSWDDCEEAPGDDYQAGHEQPPSAVIMDCCEASTRAAAFQSAIRIAQREIAELMDAMQEMIADSNDW